MFKIKREDNVVLIAAENARTEAKKRLFLSDHMVDAIVNTLISGFFKSPEGPTQMAACMLHGEPGVAKTYAAKMICEMFAQRYNMLKSDITEAKIGFSTLPINAKTLPSDFLGSKDFEAYKSGYPIIVPEGGLLNSRDILIVDDLGTGPAGDLPMSIEAIRPAMSDGTTDQMLNGDDGPELMKVVHRTQVIIFTSNVDFAELGKTNDIVESFNSRCTYAVSCKNPLFVPKEPLERSLTKIEMLLKKAIPNIANEVLDAMIFVYTECRGTRRPTPRDVVNAGRTLQKIYDGKVHLEVLAGANIGLDVIKLKQYLISNVVIPKYEPLVNRIEEMVQEGKTALQKYGKISIALMSVKDALDVKRRLMTIFKSLNTLEIDFDDRLMGEVNDLKARLSQAIHLINSYMT